MPGYNHINCKPCESGTRKLSIFEETCQPCDLSNATVSKKLFTDFNNCSNYKCIDSRVQLSQTINPYCMTSYEVFSSMFIGHISKFGYLFLALFLLMGIATLNRKYRFIQKICRKKKKIWMEETHFYDRAYVCFAFQGENTTENQWFLEMDVSKDFNSSIVSRQDYLSLARVNFS